jgi:hypothetical protein
MPLYPVLATQQHKAIAQHHLVIVRSICGNVRYDLTSNSKPAVFVSHRGMAIYAYFMRCRSGNNIKICFINM